MINKLKNGLNTIITNIQAFYRCVLILFSLLVLFLIFNTILQKDLKNVNRSLYNSRSNVSTLNYFIINSW